VSKPVPIGNVQAAAPAGRLDILLIRLAEFATRAVEKRIGGGCNLWDGDGGIKSVVEAKIDQMGVPREQLTPAMIAEYSGFLKAKKRRIRRAG
jgi:hypothetical protein